MRATASIVLASAILGASCFAADEGVVGHVGNDAIKFPTLPGLVPACRDNARFAEMTALLTTPLEESITCWVGAKAWADRANEKLGYPHPLVTLTRAKAPFVVGKSDFDKLKVMEAKMATPGQPLPDTDAIIAAQNQALARAGFHLQNGKLNGHYEGVFDESATSISVILVRKGATTINGTSMPNGEVVAITNVLVRGNILALRVIDQDDGDLSAAEVKDISRAWLSAWSKSSAER
jgi:hypothetical protein